MKTIALLINVCAHDWTAERAILASNESETVISLKSVSHNTTVSN